VGLTKLSSITHNVHENCGDNVKRVQGDIASDVYDYFFFHVLAGNHGSRQAMINFFFQRLYEQCVTEGIRPIWEDVDTNGERVVNILNRMNFDGPTSP
jgi:hypothetical protein